MSPAVGPSRTTRGPWEPWSRVLRAKLEEACGPRTSDEEGIILEGSRTTCSSWTLGLTRHGNEHRTETTGDRAWKRLCSTKGLAYDDDDPKHGMFKSCLVVKNWIIHFLFHHNVPVDRSMDHFKDVFTLKQYLQVKASQEVSKIRCLSSAEDSLAKFQIHTGKKTWFHGTWFGSLWCFRVGRCLTLQPKLYDLHRP